MINDLPPLMQEEKSYKTKLVGETKLNQERLRKKEMEKAENALDEIGQADEKKGIAATKRAYDDYIEEIKSVKSERISWLNSKAKEGGKRAKYYRSVDTLVRYELSFLAVPPGYSVRSEVTPQGIKLILKDRFGSVHIGGFTPCGLGLYDEQACRTSVNKVDDLINYLERNPPNGLYLS